MGNWIGTPTLYQMIYISNNTVKWNYTIENYSSYWYDLQNSSVVSLLAPEIENGSLLLDVRTIINSSSTSLLNSQNILCSNYSEIFLKASNNYYAIFNGSLLQVFNYCQNCSSIWSLSLSNITHL